MYSVRSELLGTLHIAEFPLAKIQALLGEDNPIQTLWIQNPSDNTGPQPSGQVRISFSSPRFVDSYGTGHNVAEASDDLAKKLQESKLCRCGCSKEECKYSY